MGNVNTKKNNVDEVTSKTSNSLMKKTRAQLVEIILRKDEVERNLRKDVNKLCNSFDKIKTEKELLEQRFETLQNDYQEECDENTSYLQELRNRVERYKTLFCIFFAISVGIIVSIIL